jgi:predicted ferric reductase
MGSVRTPIKIFRKEPPREFVEEILRHLGFIGFHDLRWFSKEEARLNTIDEWLPTLESYYLPCKAARFIHKWSPTSIITILRHILHSQGYDLQKEERLYNGHKTMLYQIQSAVSFKDLSGASLEVSFD